MDLTKGIVGVVGTIVALFMAWYLMTKLFPQNQSLLSGNTIAPTPGIFNWLLQPADSASLLANNAAVTIGEATLSGPANGVTGSWDSISD